MSRAFVIAILSSGFLAAFAFVPPVIEPIVGADISNAAHAVKNLNSSRSNIYRMGGGPGKKAAVKKGTPKPNLP